MHLLLSLTSSPSATICLSTLWGSWYPHRVVLVELKWQEEEWSSPSHFKSLLKQLDLDSWTNELITIVSNQLSCELSLTWLKVKWSAGQRTVDVLTVSLFHWRRKEKLLQLGSWYQISHTKYLELCFQITPHCDNDGEGVQFWFLLVNFGSETRGFDRALPPGVQHHFVWLAEDSSCADRHFALPMMLPHPNEPCSKTTTEETNSGCRLIIPPESRSLQTRTFTLRILLFFTHMHVDYPAAAAA